MILTSLLLSTAIALPDTTPRTTTYKPPCAMLHQSKVHVRKTNDVRILHDISLRSNRIRIHETITHNNTTLFESSITGTITPFRSVFASEERLPLSFPKSRLVARYVVDDAGRGKCKPLRYARAFTTTQKPSANHQTV
jgi:hypothetical protein